MNRESNWGTDVEIYAASAILDPDVYIANNFYKTKESIIREVRWSLHRATDNPTALYPKLLRSLSTCRINAEHELQDLWNYFR